MADWNVYSRSSPNRDADFEEAEIWPLMDETHDSSSNKWNFSREYDNNNTDGSSSAWQIQSSPRKIPNSSTTSNESKVFRQSSAPVNIPDWSKIYGKKATSDSWAYNNGCNGDDNNDGEEYDDFRVPPHEYLAEKLARRRISSSSVCQGIGRTLKGRDLSKVRNAILTRTGFLE